MHSKSLLGPALAVVCALAMWSCQGVSPASPTALTGGGATLRPFDEAPAPVTTTINIIGSVGDMAFAPNPIQAALGDMIVWMNGDTRLHHIVLDDGTDIGDVLPGQSTVPLKLGSTVATGFHCTIHPTMVGAINGDLPAAPPPYYPPPYDPDPYY